MSAGSWSTSQIHLITSYTQRASLITGVMQECPVVWQIEWCSSFWPPPTVHDAHFFPGLLLAAGIPLVPKDFALMSSVSTFTVGCAFQDESYDPPERFKIHLVGHNQHFYFFFFVQRSRTEKSVSDMSHLAAMIVFKPYFQRKCVLLSVYATLYTFAYTLTGHIYIMKTNLWWAKR